MNKGHSLPQIEITFFYIGGPIGHWLLAQWWLPCGENHYWRFIHTNLIPLSLHAQKNLFKILFLIHQVENLIRNNLYRIIFLLSGEKYNYCRFQSGSIFNQVCGFSEVSAREFRILQETGQEHEGPQPGARQQQNWEKKADQSTSQDGRFRLNLFRPSAAIYFFRHQNFAFVIRNTFGNNGKRRKKIYCRGAPLAPCSTSPPVYY